MYRPFLYSFISHYSLPVSAYPLCTLFVVFFHFLSLPLFHIFFSCRSLSTFHSVYFLFFSSNFVFFIVYRLCVFARICFPFLIILFSSLFSFFSLPFYRTFLTSFVSLFSCAPCGSRTSVSPVTGYDRSKIDSLLTFLQLGLVIHYESSNKVFQKWE